MKHGWEEGIDGRLAETIDCGSRGGFQEDESNGGLFNVLDDHGDGFTSAPASTTRSCRSFDDTSTTTPRSGSSTTPSVTCDPNRSRMPRSDHRSEASAFDENASRRDAKAQRTK